MVLPGHRPDQRKLFISVIVSDETNRNLYRCTVSDSFNDSIVSDTALLKREGSSLPYSQRIILA